MNYTEAELQFAINVAIEAHKQKVKRAIEQLERPILESPDESLQDNMLQYNRMLSALTYLKKELGL